ncbi:MAG TPA: protease pro-enzyme activation domain-containing protein [Verrucomicrobiae bacterium]|nr:protease pro-enzyme activation domain-containing protein [Verrucomicrobiae bacterium]
MLSSFLMPFYRAALLAGIATLLSLSSHGAPARKVLSRHVPATVARLQPQDRLPATNQLSLALGLPLRNRGALTNLLRDLYDPAHPRFRKFLTPEEFTEQFGPTEKEYEATVAFARTNGMVISERHPNRMLVTVTGAVGDIERAFGVRLRLYQHPEEARQFFAPDTEPSVAAGTPILRVSGLDNYKVPKPMFRPVDPVDGAKALPRNGSGPAGSYWGNDFRKIYVPGTTLTGAGQMVALVQFGGYYLSDITNYVKQSGIATVPLENVLVNGYNGVPDSRAPGSDNEEVALDIEVVNAMAPGLAKILVYETANNVNTVATDNLFNRIATDNRARQISCSWGNFDIDALSQQIFQEYAAQGQSFFMASGDSGAFGAMVPTVSDTPLLTQVGGTTVTTSSARAWVSETTWDGSSGGASSYFPIPEWQQGIDMSANGGSSTMRNTPDVAMIGDNVWVLADRGRSFAVGGTSVAAPLWAAFTALVNEQGAAAGLPPVGFLNPALYAIGKSPLYSQCFHDITTGNNFSQDSPNLYSAVPGYDLCTGWGTPNGTNLINALLSPPIDPLLLSPPFGFTATGKVGGPFSTTRQVYTVANGGIAPVAWSLSAAPAWLTVTPASGGTLPPGGNATITISLNTAATNLSLGNYITTLWFTNRTSGVAQSREFDFFPGNAGFETGDFTNWTANVKSSSNFADSIDTDLLYGQTLDGVPDAMFVHSGIYGAFLGQANSLGTLAQTLSTVPGGTYTVSFWFANPVGGGVNQFHAVWDGQPLFDGVSLDQIDWTNMVYNVTASTARTVLKFTFRNDDNAFGLDDVSVQLVPQASPPAFSGLAVNSGIITLSWTGTAGLAYQVQTTADLAGAWINVGDALTGTGDTLTFSESVAPGTQHFYRLVVQ